MSKINIGLHGLDISYDWVIFDNVILENSLGAGMGMSVNRNTPYYLFLFEKPTPYFKTSIRYHYNMLKRFKKLESVSLNSGNYFSAQAKYSFGNNSVMDNNKTILTELHWGLQRTAGEKFMFNGHIGLGYLHDFHNSSGSLTPTFGLRFGYQLF